MYYKNDKNGEKEKKNYLSWAEFVPARLSVEGSLKRAS